MIYFMGCPAADAVKIGKCGGSRYLYSRLSNIQSNNPFQLCILGAEPGYTVEERALHARFAHLRIRGEWFRMEADLAAHIATLSIPEKPFGTRPKHQIIPALSASHRSAQLGPSARVAPNATDGPLPTRAVP